MRSIVHRGRESCVRGSLASSPAGRLIRGEILAPKLKMDNKSALTLMKNPVHHDRSKHIDIKFHFIRECCDKKLIDVEFIDTEMLSDIITQALGRVRFQELRHRIGMVKLV